MPGFEPIHNEKELRERWQKEAEAQTLESLPAFLQSLADFEHDYASIIIAHGAAALGALHAMNRSPMGGITGFQAGLIMWEIVRGWMDYDAPLQLRNWEHMLYPQYEDQFTQTMDAPTWAWLQEKAKQLILESVEQHHAVNGHVMQHWQSIAQGQIPFGYTLEEEEPPRPSPDVMSAILEAMSQDLGDAMEEPMEEGEGKNERPD